MTCPKPTETRPGLITALQQKTIARDLTFRLCLASIAILIVAGNFFAFLLAHKAEGDLHRRAERLSEEVAQVLAVPLWTYNTELIRKIGHAYESASDVVGISIEDELDQSVYRSYGAKAGDFTITRNVYHDGQEMGSITFEFTTGSIRVLQYQILLVSIVFLTLITVVLIVTTNLLLRRYLSRPLAILSQGLEKIQSGEYHHTLPGLGSVDLDNIADRVCLMAEEIDRRDGALRTSERRYRELFDSISDYIYTHDLKGRLIAANRIVADVLGQKPESLTGRMISDFMPEHRRTAFGTAYLALLLEKGRAEGLAEVLGRDGALRYIEYRSFVTQDDAGNATVSGMGRDLTERISAEHEVRKMEEQLVQAQKMEAVGTLASGIAHDFNNLLQAISGYAQLLQIRLAKDEASSAHLAKIEKASDRAADLVRGLLAFSRKEKPVLRPVNMSEVAQEAIHFLERTIPKMVTLKTSLAPDVRTINADPTQIEQIIMNLGANARDAMAEGGTLTITTGNVQLDQAYCNANLEASVGPHVRLTVNDTGHGMDAETVRHIFEPFYTTKEIGKGTGLGLSTVYGIVKTHGGHITCESRMGVGTTFRVHLPALRVEGEGEETRNEEEKTPPGGAEHILVVDDEVILQELCKGALEASGYAVTTAGSGEEALDLIARDHVRFDLVILDLGMPGMGGRKCLERILEQNPSTRILVASGYGRTNLTEGLTGDGAAGFIGKPFRIPDLISAARRILDGHANGS